MANKNSQLLTPTELLDIYGAPTLNEVEVREYLTFNQAETKALKKYSNPADAVYFATCLVYFKLKHTLVDFKYQEITLERRHIMERYLPNKKSPRALPQDRYRKIKLENKALKLCGYERYSEKICAQLDLKGKLLKLATSHPRQRQLCKAFLDLLIRNRVAIPAYSTVQDIVSEIWNKENSRVIKNYKRYTTKSQRDIITTLLLKTEKHYNIISIKQDMKGFNTSELESETSKYNNLQPVFKIAKQVLPKLGLPVATIDYYANLINYYTGTRLQDVNKHLAQFYLLCYSFSRFQILNDNLLAALKKRTLDYDKKGKEHADTQALKQLDIIKETRQKVSNMLVAIKNYPNEKNIPKSELYRYIPEDELLTAAAMLVDDNFDKTLLYWQYIDEAESAIKLNLRKIFLTLEFTVVNNDPLAAVISYLKSSLFNNTFHKQPLPHYVKEWVKDSKYIFCDGEVIHNRLEFLIYLQIVHHISTNKLTLKYTIQHKQVNDDLMPGAKWDKDKPKILRSLGYSKLRSPIEKTLATKKPKLIALYETVNDDAITGRNEDIILSNKNGKQQWRLRPLEAASEPNDSFLAEFQQRSIVNVIHFVNSKTSFMRGFESILPKSTKSMQDISLIMAVVLANAIRIGARKIADISDLKESSLLTAEAAYIRIETLIAVTNIINNTAAKLPIFRQWYINSILHGSIDGDKQETTLRNILARHSPKYFGRGIGVSSYNEIVNSFSIAGRLIGANEYEGNFAFEMVHHQNTSDIKPECISTDKHGMNSLNFGLFDITNDIYAPRIPKPHTETLWGFGKPKDYEGYIIKPTKFANESLLADEWNNIQHFVASLLTGDCKPSIVIRKLSSKNYTSKTKRAFVQYNNIVKSEFILKYLHNPEFRRAIMIALNRGEAYNNLYRAITIHNKGELRGQSEIEMEIWHQCTRLISSIMLYYNSYILNKLYVTAKSKAEKEFIASVSPCAWSHINLLGYYQFCGRFDDKVMERWIKEWDWKKVGAIC